MKASHRASALAPALHLALHLALALALLAACGGGHTPALDLATAQSNRAQAESDLKKLQTWCADSVKAMRAFTQAAPESASASAAEVTTLIAMAANTRAWHDSAAASLGQASANLQLAEASLKAPASNRAISETESKRLAQAAKTERAWLDIDAHSLALLDSIADPIAKSLGAVDQSIGGRIAHQAAVDDVLALMSRLASAHAAATDEAARGWLGPLLPGPSRAPANTRTASVEDLVVNDTILPANADLNNLGAMEVKDTNYLFSGIGEYEQGGFRGSKSVVVRGVWAPPNTRVVRLNIARGSSNSVDVWTNQGSAGGQSKLALVDDLGRAYMPIGFIHSTATGDRRVTIKLQRDGAFDTIGAFPNPQGSGADKIYALFTPAVGRKIVGVKLGDEWIAAAALEIKSAE